MPTIDTTKVLNERIAYWVMRGRIDIAREFATELAKDRDNRPTLAESEAATEAVLAHRHLAHAALAAA
ncbi:hypothetical protein [Microbacterium soli]|uniref:Antitoxin VbhA domain-containing protein n=1 Tax=Microbacterium soli TaxID=446075 RepID=A0ABP7NI78_9MICO